MLCELREKHPACPFSLSSLRNPRPITPDCLFNDGYPAKLVKAALYQGGSKNLTLFQNLFFVVRLYWPA